MAWNNYTGLSGLINQPQPTGTLAGMVGQSPIDYLRNVRPGIPNMQFGPDMSAYMPPSMSSPMPPQQGGPGMSAPLPPIQQPQGWQARMDVQPPNRMGGHRLSNLWRREP